MDADVLAVDLGYCCFFCYSNDDWLPEVSLQLREFKLLKNTNKHKKKSRSCQDGCSHVDLQSQIYGSMSFFSPSGGA